MPRKKGIKRKSDTKASTKSKKKVKKAAPALVEEDCEPSRPLREASDGDLKIMCFNVNGIRAANKKGFSDYLKEEDADIVCMSELKCSLEDSPLTEEFKEMGYHMHWGESADKGRHGSCILTKREPISVVQGIGASDSDGRAITCEFDGFYIINCYVPNSGQGLKFKERRLAWDKKMKTHLENLQKEKPIIWTGDLNVAIKDFDVYDGETNKNRKKTPGFTPYERENFGNLVSELDLVDVYREFYPTKKNTFTFWGYRGNMRPTNRGWRLDYFITSRPILELVKNIEIRKENKQSDHVPLILILEEPKAIKATN